MSSDVGEKSKTLKKKSEGILFIPVDEIDDVKNQSKIAHHSISPKYDVDGKLIGYNVGGYTQSYIKKQKVQTRNNRSAQ